MTKRSKQVHRKAKRLGEYLGKDSYRKDGGMIYSVRAIREREWRMGKLGPASAVRRINPTTGEVIEEIKTTSPA